MLIRMYENKAVQDAGTERPFRVGESYYVSPVIGAQWVAAGVAREVTPADPDKRAPKAKPPKGDAAG
jgi:hypothetical protein